MLFMAALSTTLWVSLRDWGTLSWKGLPVALYTARSRNSSEIQGSDGLARGAFGYVSCRVRVVNGGIDRLKSIVPQWVFFSFSFFSFLSSMYRRWYRSFFGVGVAGIPISGF
jgi:hypothetical protein